MDQVVAVLTDPDRRTVQAAGSSGGAGTVTVADGAAVVVTRGLQTLPDDRTYQLGVIEGDRARSAGLLGGDGDAQAYVDEVPPGALLGVTVEPRAGSREPTTEPVLLADMAG
jgi:anti-sigma-K factor RskA